MVNGLMDGEEALQRETSKRQTVEIALLKNCLVRFAMIPVMIIVIYYDAIVIYYDVVCPFAMMKL